MTGPTLLAFTFLLSLFGLGILFWAIDSFIE